MASLTGCLTSPAGLLAQLGRALKWRGARLIPGEPPTVAECAKSFPRYHRFRRVAHERQRGSVADLRDEHTVLRVQRDRLAERFCQCLTRPLRVAFGCSF